MVVQHQGKKEKILVARFSQWHRKQRLALASKCAPYDETLYRRIEWDEIGAWIWNRRTRDTAAVIRN